MGIISNGAKIIPQSHNQIKLWNLNFYKKANLQQTLTIFSLINISSVRVIDKSLHAMNYFIVAIILLTKAEHQYKKEKKNHNLLNLKESDKNERKE